MPRERSTSPELFLIRVVPGHGLVIVAIVVGESFQVHGVSDNWAERGDCGAVDPGGVLVISMLADTGAPVSSPSEAGQYSRPRHHHGIRLSACRRLGQPHR